MKIATLAALSLAVVFNQCPPPAPSSPPPGNPPPPLVGDIQGAGGGGQYISNGHPRYACCGDCQGDGVVSWEDVVAAQQIHENGVPLSRCRSADCDGDGDVDAADVAAVRALYGASCN